MIECVVFYCGQRLYDGPMRNLERSSWFKRDLKMLIFFAVAISVGSAFQIFIVQTEKKLLWVLFLIIGIESLKG